MGDKEPAKPSRKARKQEPRGAKGALPADPPEGASVLLSDGPSLDAQNSGLAFPRRSDVPRVGRLRSGTEPPNGGVHELDGENHAPPSFLPAMTSLNEQLTSVGKCASDLAENGQKCSSAAQSCSRSSEALRASIVKVDGLQASVETNNRLVAEMNSTMTTVLDEAKKAQVHEPRSPLPAPRSPLPAPRSPLPANSHSCGPSCRHRDRRRLRSTATPRIITTASASGSPGFRW